MSVITERLIKLMNEKGITIKDVVESTGIKETRIKRFLNNDVEKMKVSEINALSKYFDVMGEYLIGGIDFREWSFAINGNENFKVKNVSYDKACKQYMEYLIENKTVVVNGIE